MRFLQATLVRALLHAEPALLEYYLHPGSAFEPFGRAVFLYGERRLALIFRRDTPHDLITRAAAAAAPYLQDIDLLELAPANGEPLQPQRFTLTVRPTTERAQQALRASVSEGLKTARCKHTERRDDRGRLYELHGGNKLGLRHALIDERDGSLELELDVREDLKPSLMALLPRGAFEVELPLSTAVAT